MEADSRLPVVLLWHMHQPQYRDALTGQYVLPWTYLHAIKDYTDMAAHLEGNPAARAVVNFTPVLLEQLEEISRRVGEHLRTGSALPDPVLALLGPDPVPAEPAGRLELLRACLKAQRKQMIERFGPYLELATIAETLGTLERVSYASDQLIHDLAVWYHLAWLGETVRRSDTLVSSLTQQGRAFTDVQRRDLLSLIGNLVASIVPRYRQLSERGQCELSVTPYGHPIMPLLLDFHAARDAVPNMQLPKHPAYPGGAERAQWHIRESLRVFRQAFGSDPSGCWPSEGAISRGSLELLDRAGFKWAATSANVLQGALARNAPQAARDSDAYNRPYRLPGGNMLEFFRDDTLSDLIGFTYATWHGDDAAHNLVNELAHLARQYADSATAEPQGKNTNDARKRHAVLIALDGENAWEHYPFNGYYFLRALYSLLAAHPQLELTTLSDCVARGVEPVPLVNVVAGSWVHGTLATWMGDAAKNRAWDLLCEAKVAFDGIMASGALDAPQRAATERQLALCESSDWFWWFGDYNPADAVSQFDSLYRRQLVVLYRLLGLPPPESLAQPISIGRGRPEHGGVMRRAYAS
ncbi:MAG TPA: glycoside hydrolase family 57 protein [Steroidobacteraceae bacterium]|jgi:alpha-amylase/alpha-mannosidase (GH57 family)|nr:glycoside hydrolase family 57 protein [Steroidobacteraceae bacterium]